MIDITVRGDATHLDSEKQITSLSIKLCISLDENENGCLLKLADQIVFEITLKRRKKMVFYWMSLTALEIVG